jgi:hypothetical protein
METATETRAGRRAEEDVVVGMVYTTKDMAELGLEPICSEREATRGIYKRKGHPGVRFLADPIGGGKFQVHAKYPIVEKLPRI